MIIFRSFQRLLLVFLFVSLAHSGADGQVTITATRLNFDACNNLPTNAYTLGDIVVKETVKTDFGIGTNVTLILSAPINFEFTDAGSIAFQSGLNISSMNHTLTDPSTITITYTVSGDNRLADNFTLSGVMIRATSAPSSGNITCAGGTGSINGISVGTVFASLTVNNTILVPPDAPDQSRCARITCYDSRRWQHFVLFVVGCS